MLFTCILCFVGDNIMNTCFILTLSFAIVHNIIDILFVCLQFFSHLGSRFFIHKNEIIIVRLNVMRDMPNNAHIWNQAILSMFLGCSFA